MYRSYSYNNMPEPVMPSPKHIEKKTVQNQTEKKADLSTDELILMLVTALLLMNECDDKPLLLALAYVFISDKL